MGFFSKVGESKKSSSKKGKSLFSFKSSGKSSRSSGLFSKATVKKKSVSPSKKSSRSSNNKGADRLLNDINKKVIPRTQAAGRKAYEKAKPTLEKVKVKGKVAIAKGKEKGKDLVSRGSAYLKTKFNKKEKEPLKGEPNKENFMEKDKKPEILREEYKKKKADMYRKEKGMPEKHYETETFEV